MTENSSGFSYCINGVFETKASRTGNSWRIGQRVVMEPEKITSERYGLEYKIRQGGGVSGVVRKHLTFLFLCFSDFYGVPNIQRAFII
jgi:hypothetical protein